MHFSIFHMTMCMYSLKHEAQPEVFQNVFSGFWWVIPTGTLKLQAGDMVLLYTKKNYREMQILEAQY